MALLRIVVCHFLIICQSHLDLILEHDFTMEDLINNVSLFSHEFVISWRHFNFFTYY